MELFIQKMEALLSTKRPYFLIILGTITLIGLILFLSSFIHFFITLPKEFSTYITEYIKIGGWILLVSGILWIILIGSKIEGRLSLEDFLENIGNKEFTRHDFAKFLYGEEIESKDYKYKRLGRILRNAIGSMIEVSGSLENKTLYKIIEKKNNRKKKIG